MKKVSPYHDEATLVSALLAKEKPAFDYLYKHYSGALFGVIDRIVKSEEIASDLLQDAFVKIWRSLDVYNSQKGSLFTWMLNICRNMAIDTLRSKPYRNESQNRNMEDLVYIIDSQNQVNTPVDHIGLREQVSKLKPVQRILIDKIYFEGYTQDEVAKQLEIPLGTVKTRLRSAISELRALIKE